ncbi:hypothetical protein OSO01_05800 [Oceanobacillus sojae]|uniref:Uncharacterized protein n=1 Tax=Oceanobacillus sojae TaxID=582851 RepID=A0A511ZEK1_9BACI|nr:hypothetical protein OSO01_05800 [Oceanobacillus sojae]
MEANSKLIASSLVNVILGVKFGIFGWDIMILLSLKMDISNKMYLREIYSQIQRSQPIYSLAQSRCRHITIIFVFRENGLRVYKRREDI